MRNRRNSASIFGQTLFLSRNEIENSCADALKSSGFMPDAPGPVRIDAFVESYFGLRVEYRDDLGEGVLGCTEFSKDGRPTRIIIGDTGEASTSYERRVRSTTAHEAGHALLHSVLFMDDQRQMNFYSGGSAENVDLARSMILCRDEDLNGRTGNPYDGRWWEWQANQAIGEFLMPRNLVMDSLDGDLKVNGMTEVVTLESGKLEECSRTLAEVFDVNPAVARIRLLHLFPEADSGQLYL